MNEEFFDCLVEETQSYVEAAMLGQTRQWLLTKGYTEEYANLDLPHGHVLHDHIHKHYLAVKRDMYECEQCGRILVETRDNRFASFSADAGECTHVLARDEKST